MSCFSLRCLGCWVLGLCVNLAFVATIIFTTVSFPWPAPLVVSIVYAFGLFAVTHVLYGREIVNRDNNKIDDDGSVAAAAAEDSLEDGTTDSDTTISSRAATSDNENKSATTDSTTTGKTVPTVSVYLSLLYGLFTLSVGVPGAILAIKAMPCPFDDNDFSGMDADIEYFDPRKSTWVTNTSQLPSAAVQEWNAKHDPHDEVANVYRDGLGFARLVLDDMNIVAADKGTTSAAAVYFLGATYGIRYPVLHVATGGTDNEVIQLATFIRPLWLTSVDNRYICFRAQTLTNVADDGDGDDDGASLFCGDHVRGFRSTPTPFNDGVVPVNFADLGDGLLWFQQAYPVGFYGNWDENDETERANGYAVVSVDPANLTSVTIHSTLEDPESYSVPPSATTTSAQPTTTNGSLTVINENESQLVYEGEGCNNFGGMVVLSTPAAAILLFISAVPMTLLSAWLWYRRSIPSSSVSLFLSCAIFLGSLLALGDPYGFVGGFFFWMVFVTPFWLFVCVYVLTVTTRVAKAPLEWSIYVLSLAVFICAIFSLYEMDYEILQYHGRVGTTLPTAIVLLVFVFAPLACIGIVVGSICVLLMAVLGITIDVTSATYMMLSHRTKVAAFVIVVECLVLFAGTVRVCQTRKSRQKQMIEGLRKCNGYVCGRSNVVADDETGGTESLLLSGNGNEDGDAEDTGIFT